MKDTKCMLINIVVLFSDSGYKPKCKTKGNKPCKFPFNYNGKTYQTCTKDGARPEAGPWCPFKVDSNGNFSTNNWGYCIEDCPKEDLKNGENFEIFCYGVIQKPSGQR